MRKSASTGENTEPRPIVVVGASLGGTGALERLLSCMRTGFPCAVAVVLHRGVNSNEGLVSLLQKYTELPVIEVEDKQPILPGCVYLAPPDYHLLVEHGFFALSIDPKVQHARPSIDVLFESASQAYGRRVIGVVLTGSNRDGADGLAAITQCGGTGIVQDPDTAVSETMPKAAIEAAVNFRVLPLDEITGFILGLAKQMGV